MTSVRQPAIDFDRLACVRSARRKVTRLNTLVDRLREQAALAADGRSAAVLRTTADHLTRQTTDLLDELRQVAELDQLLDQLHTEWAIALTVPTVLALPAYRRGRQLWVWCEHERKWHTHGIACDFTCGMSRREDMIARQRGERPLCQHPMGHGNGDRASHCRCPYSPLASGYYLIEDGELTEGILEAHGRILNSCTCRRQPVWRHPVNQPNRPAS